MEKTLSLVWPKNRNLAARRLTIMLSVEDGARGFREVHFGGGNRCGPPKAGVVTTIIDASLVMLGWGATVREREVCERIIANAASPGPRGRNARISRRCRDYPQVSGRDGLSGKAAFTSWKNLAAGSPPCWSFPAYKTRIPRIFGSPEHSNS